MTDLTKGIIEINNFEFHPGTTLDELVEFYGDKVRVVELSTGLRMKFQEPFYITENIYAYNFDFSKEGILKKFSLIPVAPAEIVDTEEKTLNKLETSKKWLKGMIKDKPNEDCESIGYSYDWGYIVSLISEDRDYGLRGGEIVVKFRED